MDIQMVEQPDTLAKQERCYVQVDLVHQPQVEAAAGC
jgi:hypothetical protein